MTQQCRAAPPNRLGGPVWPRRETMHPGDEVPPGTAEAGENICRVCGGSGRLDTGERCPSCGGTGRITEMLPDA